ncbi:MAG: hypothetical protein ACODAB_09785 [Gemmatimonadota bacterium]
MIVFNENPRDDGSRPTLRVDDDGTWMRVDQGAPTEPVVISFGDRHGKMASLTLGPDEVEALSDHLDMMRTGMK